MDAPRIAGPNPTNPNHGVSSLRHDQNRRRKRSFEQAFGKEASKREREVEPKSSSAGVASDNTTDDRNERSPSGGLQHREGIIRKDEEDGQLHVDIVV